MGHKMSAVRVAAVTAAAIFFMSPASVHSRDENAPLTLKECVSMALERNTALLTARERRNHAENRRKEAFGLALPDVSFTGSYTYQGNLARYELAPGQYITFAPEHNYLLDFSVSQWMYSSAVSAGYEAAKLLEKAAAESVEAARINVVAAVKLKFYAALFTRDVMAASEEALNRAWSHAKDAQERKAVGLASDYDVKRFEVSAAEAGANLASARNEYARAIADLTETLAMDAASGLRLAGELAYEPFEMPIEKAMESARENRPDVRAARENHEAAKNITNAARSELLPTAQAFGGYKRSNTDFHSDATFGWRTDWNVGVKVEMNLFDGWERSSRVRQRISEEEIARLERENAERLAMLEVKTAGEELARAKESVEAQAKNVEYAQETYRIVSERRKVGMATHLELLDAHVALTGAKVNHSRALFEHMAAKTKLQRAMGTMDDWEK